jgi:hypothetical protein
MASLHAASMKKDHKLAARQNTDARTGAVDMPRTRRKVAVPALVLGAIVLLGAIAWTAYAALRPHRGNQEVAKALAAIAQNQQAWDNPWDMPSAKIETLRNFLRKESDPSKRFEFERDIAHYYVVAGTSEPAIDQLESMQKKYGDSLPPQLAEMLKSDIAFAYFRMGEQQNCAWNHNSDACVFPLKDGGIHSYKFGMAEAAKRYADLLADPKTDRENVFLYRWLLNIAYMTLGKYPAEVPKQWLIPEEAFKSAHDPGMFRDVALGAGLAEFGHAGGVVMEDFDNDGFLDLLVSHFGIRDQMHYFHNNGDGTFTRMTEKAGLTGITGGLNIVQADYNNDGCIDVFVPRGAWLHDKGQFPASLLRNNCDGTFTDVAKQAGITLALPSQTAAWADVNGDGLLDLFVGYEIVRKQVRWPAGTKNFALYLNNGDGTFTEVGAQSGIQLDGMVKGSVFGDYDNDGKPDLYVSVMGGPNHLFRNVSNGKQVRFEDVTAKAGVAEPVWSFTCWFFDYDNDGWPDIFVSGYQASMPNIVREFLGDKANAKGERPRLYHNNHDGTFTDVSKEVGIDQLLLTMGANFGDLDNDGWLDFYLGTGAAPLNNLVPNRMFRNDRGRRFQDVTTAGGFGHLQKGHSVAFGDLHDNGLQDVFAVIGGVVESDGFWSVLYKNPGNTNHWVKLRLTGRKANRFAEGARIRVDATTGDGSKRSIYRDVTSGGSFGSASLRPHIGLGDATKVDRIEVRWPGSDLRQVFNGPFDGDSIYELVEGKPEAKRLERPRRQQQAAR